LEKFATTLRLRCPWIQWKDPNKDWAGSGNPCNRDDVEIFYSATTITHGNRRKSPFWHPPWLRGSKPIDITPLIFASPKRKYWKVAQALHEDAWVGKIDLERTFTVEHLTQFIDLWVLIDNVHLDKNVENDIVWRLVASTRPSRLTRCNFGIHIF
jgi:hypothetical protein